MWRQDDNMRYACMLLGAFPCEPARSTLTRQLAAMQQGGAVLTRTQIP